ncbi:sortase domain-containing protein [Thalassotalea agarivorans]|uniref:Sortase A n=1 Tax=Thalassotalea agarivorans TaxID=349064 RepID=A0A1H9Y6T3_THASX|nr:sortase [Thalassotalea agarivorans]SES64592.1 sortase A [Thalassotalea agarivorans]
MHNFIKILLAMTVLTAFILLGQILVIKGKAFIAQQLLQHSWQDYKQSKTSAPKRPWPWADMYPVAELVFEKQEKRYIVLNTDSGQALAFAPGLNGVSQENLTIISAHNDTHFDDIADFEQGDTITLESKQFSRSLSQSYRVFDTQIIDLSQGEIFVSQPPQEPHLLLVTCYPFNTNFEQTSQRLVVFAKAHQPELVSL